MHITVPNVAAAGADLNNINKELLFKNWAPFTSCIIEMNNTQVVYDAQKFDIVLPMYYLIEYSDAYLTISGSLCQYYWEEIALNNSGEIIDFPADNNSALFKFKQQITGQTRNGGTKDVEMMVPLKYLSSFWRTTEMPLINCEICLQLKWSKNCILVAGTVTNQNPSFRINDTKPHFCCNFINSRKHKIP